MKVRVKPTPKECSECTDKWIETGVRTRSCKYCGKIFEVLAFVDKNVMCKDEDGEIYCIKYSKCKIIEEDEE